MRAKLHNEEATIREKMKNLQKASEAQMKDTQRKMNLLQTENTRLKRELAALKSNKGAANARGAGKNASLFPGASKKDMISLKRPRDNNKGRRICRRTNLSSCFVVFLDWDHTYMMSPVGEGEVSPQKSRRSKGDCVNFIV